MHGCSRNFVRNYPVCEARHNIGFKSQGWNAAQDCREHCRPGSISAHTNYDVSAKFRKDAACVPNRARQIEEGLEPRCQAHSVQCADLYQSQRESRSRDQPVLNPPGRPDEQDFSAIVLLEFLSDSERGDNMAASTASRQNGSHKLTINVASNLNEAFSFRRVQHNKSSDSRILKLCGASPVPASVLAIRRKNRPYPE